MKAKTSCGGCIFLSNNVCKLDRHKKFKKNNAKIEQENGVPVVVGRYCSAYRSENWSKNKNDENLDIIVRAELLAKTHVFIYTEDWSESNIKKTIKSIENQLLQPSSCTIVGCKNGLTYKNAAILYKYGNIVASIDSNYTLYQCVDLAINNCKSYFYVVVKSGQKLPKNFLANIDEKINYKLEQFVCIKGHNIIVYGASLDVHNKYFGSADGTIVEESGEISYSGKNLIDKIEDTAKRCNEMGLIKDEQEFV